jgi:hypothetical protein
MSGLPSKNPAMDIPQSERCTGARVAEIIRLIGSRLWAFTNIPANVRLSRGT